jgi:hypothetical protein
LQCPDVGFRVFFVSYKRHRPKFVHPILGLSDEAVASRKTADRDIIFGDEPAEGNFASDRYLPVAIHDFDLAIGRYVGSIEPVALKCNAASCRLDF